MYANLRVSTRRNGDETSDEAVFAYRVSIVGSTATVFLDANEEGSYAEPAGEKVVDLTTTAMTIEADF
jgi:hypothetical protein